MNVWLVLIANTAIIGGIILAAYFGARRGLVLVALEVISFILATLLAFTSYQAVGAGIKPLAQVATPLANVTAFILVWVLAEVACALLIRFLILPHLAKHVRGSAFEGIAGATLNALKTTAIITLGLIVFSGLPVSADHKHPFTKSFVPSVLLAASGPLPDTFAAGLRRDLNDSLNFFTVTAEPESEQRIELGFTTTNVQVDESAETAMLRLVNRERTSRGLTALTANPTARAVARAYSRDMFARGYFSHQSLEGKTPFDRMTTGGVKYDRAGENLALAPTLRQAHEGLMNSPGHRANILSPDYRTVGIGIIDGGPYGLMVTQNFTD